LKKRTKKLLFFWVHAEADTRLNDQKFFASFFQKRRIFFRSSSAKHGRPSNRLSPIAFLLDTAAVFLLRSKNRRSAMPAGALE
jgi:hypothetical protein